MLEATLFERLQVEVYFLHIGRYILIVEIVYFNGLSQFEQSHLVVVEIHHLFSVLDNRQGI